MMRLEIYCFDDRNYSYYENICGDALKKIDGKCNHYTYCSNKFTLDLHEGYASCISRFTLFAKLPNGQFHIFDNADSYSELFELIDKFEDQVVF